MIKQVDAVLEEWIGTFRYERVRKYYKELPKGKRLRARLLLAIAPEHTQNITVAAIIELIHLSSLLHDDVIDDAETRRGVRSINAKYSDKTAIMLGDIYYAKAFNEMTKLDRPMALAISDGVTRLAIGELVDVDLSAAFNTDVDRYLEMIELKTAALIEATAEVAAMMAGKDAQAHKSFGRNLGIAFQIIDDILDVTQNELTLGKPAFSDLAEGKTTLPVIYLYEALDTNEQKQLTGYFKKPLEKADRKWLKTRLEETGALERAKGVARQYADEAKASVADEPELLKLVQLILSRSH